MARRLISLPFLVMAAWVMTLGWLLIDDRYQLFLAPRFKVLVTSGIGFALLFAIGAFRQPAGKTGTHLIKGLFLLLPILFVFSAGENTLGNFALSKRGMTPVRTEAPVSDASGSPGADPGAPAPEMTLEKHTENESGSAPVVTISRLIRNFPEYEGKPISVEGLFSETVVDHDELSAVFRYLITCCAADAMPVGVFIDRQEGRKLKSDDWVRVSGQVRRMQLDGFDILFMEAAVVEKKARPSKNAAYIFN